MFNPQSSNISTNYAPVIKKLREIIIREGNTVDLKKGVEAWDFEDGDITEKIVFPEIDLEFLPIGKHEVSYEVTDSDGNTTKNGYTFVNISILKESNSKIENEIIIRNILIRSKEH